MTNGVQDPDKTHLFTHLYLVPGYFLLSLDDGLEIYRTLSNNPSTESHGSQIDPKAWFPIMSSGKGDYIIVNLYEGSITEYQSKIQNLNDGFMFKDASTFFQYYSELFHDNKIELTDGVLSYDKETRDSKRTSEIKLHYNSDEKVSNPSLLKTVLRL